MNIEQLRERFPDENTCREFFESIIWHHGRRCPHCNCENSYPLSGKSSRPGLYECGCCKLPLCLWLQCMNFMVNSSKGISFIT